MAVSFGRPWFLLAAIPAAVLLLTLRGQGRYPAGSRIWIGACRGLVMSLLILALAQPYLVVAVGGRSLVFLLDQSQSVSEDYRPWLEQSMDAMGASDRAAVIGFGRDASLLKPFYMERLPSLTGSVDDEYSNMAAALAAGFSLLPGKGGRLVLLSDGRENIGDALKYGEMLAAAGTPVDVVPLSSSTQADVAIGDITLPKNTWPGQEVVVEVVVESNIDTTARLQLFWEGDLVWRQQVEIARGSQSFSAILPVTGAGPKRLRGVIDAVGDSQGRNNYGYGLTFVQAPPRLLIVEGRADKGLPLAEALIAAGLEVERSQVATADLSPVSLAAFRGVILVDVPAYALTEEETNSLEAFVRVLGGGLLAVGGRNSFGPGLYEGTPLEAMLPVKMALEEKEEAPGMDLVLVIDRSSSMYGENLNMAKNAAIRALSVLKDSDRVGIVTFDTGGKIEAPLTAATNKAEIASIIEGIAVGGGTAIHTGLSQGIELLTSKERKIKHIILLSDGQDGSKYNYEQMLAKVEDLGLTVSTIALGAGADLKLMETIAVAGGGRNYIVKEGRELPAVFLQETVLAGGEWLVEESFTPILVHPDVGLAFGAKAPVFEGYVASTAKTLAEIMLLTHRDHPLLSRWQYGLGRAVAFTSDTFGLWSEDFLLHPGFGSLWLDLVNWAAPAPGTGDMVLESRLDGAGVHIFALPTRPLDEGEQILATIVDDQGITQDFQLLPLGGGRYGATIEHAKQGVYLVSAVRHGDGESSSSQGGFVVPYPAEYRISFFSGETLLTKLAEKTGGRVLKTPEEVFAVAAAVSRRMTDVTWWLALAALILWPIDIALRRFGGLPRSRTKAVPQASIEPVEERRDEVLERLLAAKKRRR